MYQYSDTSPNYKEVERIAITGIGFVCPAGGNVWKAALAMRKKRSSFVAHETVLVADDCYGTVLRGATVGRMPHEIISRQLCGTDRAVALLSPVIRECTAGVSPQLLKTALWQLDNLMGPTAQGFPNRLQDALPELPLFGTGSGGETSQRSLRSAAVTDSQLFPKADSPKASYISSTRGASAPMWTNGIGRLTMIRQGKPFPWGKKELRRSALMREAGSKSVTRTFMAHQEHRKLFLLASGIWRRSTSTTK
jgi:hypothetical protein